MVQDGDDAALPLDVIALIDFLSSDDRPTFVLQRQPSSSGNYQIAFVNPALEQLLKSYPHEDFESWTQTIDDASSDKAIVQHIKYAGQVWRCKWLQTHDCAVVYVVGEADVTIHERPDSEMKDLIRSESPRRNNYEDEDQSKWIVDWTRFSCAAVSPWTQYLRGLAWEKTDAGPMESWSYDLRQALISLTACPEPRAMHWGKDCLMFFNEAARPMIGERSDECLGAFLERIWGHEMLHMHDNLFRDALKTGEHIKMPCVQHIYKRYDEEQDFYFDMSILPICGRDGKLNGKIFEFLDVTEDVLEDRRNNLTSTLLDHMSVTRDLAQLWSGLLKTFHETSAYLPYVLVYASTNDPDRENSSLERDVNSFVLQGAVGIPSELAPATINTTVGTGNTPLAQAFVNAFHSASVQVLQLKDGTLPPQLAFHLQDGQKVDTCCILPVKGHSEGSPLGFVAVGINKRQPFRKDDIDLMEFVRNTVSRYASLMALPRSKRHDEDHVALDLRTLSELRMLIADKKASAFASLARNAPCGMFIVNSDGTPRFLNEKCLELTGFSSYEQVRDVGRTHSFWSEVLSEEDQPRQGETGDSSVFSQTFAKGIAQKTEHRLLFPSDPRRLDNPRPFNRWIECVTLPEFGSDNRVQGLMGFIMDISDRKRAEQLQIQQEKDAQAEKQNAQQLQTALANKVAADNFIDTVSHELRNPLSATFQLADGIVSLMEPMSTDGAMASTAEAVLDSIKTILLCAQHMKTIVDDILTLSKLDSNLLALSLEKARPHELVRQTLKIYEADLRAAQIQSAINVEDSYQIHNVDTVMLDRSRTLQVLLNLTSNAIKFTKSSSVKKLTISLAAFTFRPNQQLNGVTFAEPENGPDTTESAGTTDPSSGFQKAIQEDLYILFAVTDTGRGIAQEEVVRLFKRFSQGSAKTYTEYGGSGLGLFISKKLSELQGGQIGVKSEGLGSGTTFAFYIKVKRSDSTPRSGTSTPAPSVERATPAHPHLVASNGRSKPGETPESESRSRAARKRQQFHILIVEDNLVNQKVMAKQLRHLGHIVHVADHGAEALDFLSKTQLYCQNLAASSGVNTGSSIPLSVILMDVEMPVMDGLTCTRKIREFETTGEVLQHVPIIAITANARGEQVDRALKSGVDDVVTKPFRLPSLMASVESLAAKYPCGPEGQTRRSTSIQT